MAENQDQPRFTILPDDDRTSQQVEQDVIEQHSEEAPQEEAIELDPTPVEEPLEITLGGEEDEVPQQQVPQQQNYNLGEDLVKVQQFMEETGGTLQDYVNLGKSYDDLDDKAVLTQYLMKKEGYDAEDAAFFAEDKFDFDEEYDDEKEVRRKKANLKKEVREAKSFLEQDKQKYYKEIGGHSNSQQAQEALDFYNQHQQQQEKIQSASEHFRNRTSELFGQDFKGFEFNVGDKKIPVKVNNVEQVKNNQLDINNFIGKFSNEEGQLSDFSGYHKALFMAQNGETLMKKFYEQGKADAVRESAAKAKNIDMNPRPDQSSVQTNSKSRFTIVDGDDSNRLRIKTRR